jgi:hypothetical protein
MRRVRRRAHPAEAHRRESGDGFRFYYRCLSRHNGTCHNTRSTRAEALEEAVWDTTLAILSDPERLLRHYEQHIERERREMRGDPAREVRDLAGRLQKLDHRRSGYLDLAADGDMGREDPRTKLADLDRQRNRLQEALREAQGRLDALREPQINYAHLNSILLQLNRMRLGESSMGDRRRLYQALRLQANVDEKGTVRLSGIFDPDVYLLDVLQDAPDVLTPRPQVPEETRVVVTSHTTSQRTSSPPSKSR